MTPTYSLVRSIPGVANPLPIASGFVTPAQATVWLAKNLRGDAARGVRVVEVGGRD